MKRLTNSLLILGMMLTSQTVVCADDFGAAEQSQVFRFKFAHQGNDSSLSKDSEQRVDWLYGTPMHDGVIEQKTRFQQLDATLAYPLQSRYVNLDLGVSLRRLRGVSLNGENLQAFDATLPILHAEALVNFGYPGLSASLEGSRLDSNESRIQDFRAKLSYQWSNQMGMQGGWQNKQFSLDNGTLDSTSYETTGPFVDFYLNF